MFELDGPIWANKKYEPKPFLSSADTGIPAYRRWVAQFANEHSVSYEEAVRQHVRDSMGLPAGASLAW